MRMRNRSTFGLILASISISILPFAASADEPKGDVAKAQGSWTAKVGPNGDIPLTLTLKGNAAEIKGTRPDGADFKLTCELKFDEKASPRTIDWTKFTGPGGQELPDNLGIYKLEGDTWTICSGGPGNDRPAEFKAGDEGRPMLTTWTRVKDDEKPAVAEGDLAKFQGDWTAKMGPDKDRTVKLLIKGSAITAHWPTGDGNELILKGEMKVDEKASPRKVDFINFKNPDGEQMRDNLGIYAVEGDSIKICIGGPAGERPTEFKQGDDQFPALLMFERIKK